MRRPAGPYFSHRFISQSTVLSRARGGVPLVVIGSATCGEQPVRRLSWLDLGFMLAALPARTGQTWDGHVTTRWQPRRGRARLLNGVAAGGLPRGTAVRRGWAAGNKVLPKHAERVSGRAGRVRSVGCVRAVSVDSPAGDHPERDLPVMVVLGCSARPRGISNRCSSSSQERNPCPERGRVHIAHCANPGTVLRC